MSAKHQQDTTKDTFITTWPGGYKENFSCYPVGAEEKVWSVLKLHCNLNHHCLEIGSGGGLWTVNYLLPNFRKVTCLDVIPRPAELEHDNIAYIELPDRDFSCTGVISESVDFAFSFGTFCHLSADACASYIASLYRVLRSGSYALIAFANWQRHPTFSSTAPLHKHLANERHIDGTCWFYNDLEMTRELVENAGFMEFCDTLPEFRDTLAQFYKP